MKSKEDIFEKIYKESDFTYPDRSLIHKAMDQYSEQIAIGFAEWINKTGIETTLRGEWIDFRTSPSSRYTSAELYNLYKQTLK